MKLSDVDELPMSEVIRYAAIYRYKDKAQAKINADMQAKNGR